MSHRPLVGSRALALVAGLAVALAGCGGSGGAGGGGGGASPPPTGGGPAPDAGAPDGGAAAGAPDAGARASPGPDAGASSPSPCDGLAPDLSAPAREVLRDLGTHSSCGPATTDPGGQVALAQVGVDQSDGASVHFYQAEGAAAGDLVGTLLVTSRQDLDPWFHWTASGYRGVAKNTQGPGVASSLIATFDHGGRPIALGKDFGLAAVPDGRGGSAVLERTTAPAHPGQPGPPKLSRLDDRGRSGPSALLDDDAASMLLVNWSTGHVLVLATGSSETRGRWLDESYAPLTGWFSVAGPISPRDAALRLLADGTMALSDGERWVATFRDGEARTQPPPRWLADRPRTRLATIRGGRGYALLSQDRGDAFEIVASDGTACGSVAIPKSTPAEGTTRQAARLDVGQDGTLLQVENATGDRLGFGLHCALRWWPGSLQ